MKTKGIIVIQWHASKGRGILKFNHDFDKEIVRKQPSCVKN